MVVLCWPPTQRPVRCVQEQISTIGDQGAETTRATSWKRRLLDQQSAAVGRRADQHKLKTVARPHPAGTCNPERCQMTTARPSEVNALQATTSNFVQCLPNCSGCMSSRKTDRCNLTMICCHESTPNRNSALFLEPVNYSALVLLICKVQIFRTRHSQSLHNRDSSSKCWKTQVVVHFGNKSSKEGWIGSHGKEFCGLAVPQIIAPPGIKKRRDVQGDSGANGASQTFKSTAEAGTP